MSNRPLAGLKASKTVGEPDVVCHLGEFPPGVDVAEERNQQPFYVSPFRDAAGLPILKIWRISREQHYCFEYCEGLTFLVDCGGREVWGQWRDGVSLDDVTDFLLHQVFGIILHLRGCVCVHASAVVVDGKAVLFAGASGRGKSSTAAAFAARGFPLLSDDISVVKSGNSGEPGLVVIPSVPQICLWPDSADFLYGPGAGERLPRLQSSDEKRLIRLEGPDRYAELPAPLGAVYLLAARSGEGSTPRIDPLENIASLLQLLTNGFVSGALGPQERAREFQIQGEMIRGVPVRQLVPSSDPAKLGQLCELVLNDLRSPAVSLAGRAF
ncbi:MAG TPA: hypothetical protein VNJ52_07900 [Patescibacteria group bacterium]|nr:hypothetical protein [Patescibacteria group bacterium]